MGKGATKSSDVVMKFKGASNLRSKALDLGGCWLLGATEWLKGIKLGEVSWVC